jgi:prevent-host-death family protein
MVKSSKHGVLVVSALRVRANLGQLLRQVEQESRCLVIEKRGAPKAVLLSIRDYVRLAAPEPEVLRVIGEESRRNRTDHLTSAQIDAVIQATRRQGRQKQKHR